MTKDRNLGKAEPSDMIEEGRNSRGRPVVLDRDGCGTVYVENLHVLSRYWQNRAIPLQWDCLFTLPLWLQAWQETLGRGQDCRVYVVRQQQELIGLAPIVVATDRACSMGDGDVFDYVDFPVVKGQHGSFLKILFRHLREMGVRRVDLGRIRADSPMVAALRQRGLLREYAVFTKPCDVSYEVRLPADWEDFLALLSGKQRHEIRRKIRRLQESGTITFRTVTEGREVGPAMDIFLRLFRQNRQDKAAFMTSQMESFFRNLGEKTARAGIFKLFLLEVNDHPAAAALCFDYQGTVYLYNSAYDRAYGRLSAGLLCKVYGIRESILGQRGKYDFLRGDENYKRQLGGRPIELLNCWAIMK